MVIAGDSKDWTWVLDQRCDECGFVPQTVTVDNLAARILSATNAIGQALRDDEDPRARPDSETWSRLEYAAHVRDVCRIMRLRLELIRTQDDPEFANWDQDETALAEGYSEQDPRAVGAELENTAAQLASAYADVQEQEWNRVGRRSNGSTFSAFTLGIYALHDLEHHQWDVTIPH